MLANPSATLTPGIPPEELEEDDELELLELELDDELLLEDEELLELDDEELEELELLLEELDELLDEELELDDEELELLLDDEDDELDELEEDELLDEVLLPLGIEHSFVPPATRVPAPKVDSWQRKLPLINLKVNTSARP